MYGGVQGGPRSTSSLRRGMFARCGRVLPGASGTEFFGGCAPSSAASSSKLAHLQLWDAADDREHFPRLLQGTSLDSQTSTGRVESSSR